MDKIRKRAEELLSRAEARTAAEFQALFAEHAAKGLLASGSTIRRSVIIYSNSISDALTQMQAEIGYQIDHRGRAWRTVIQSVQSALTTCEARIDDVFAPVWEIASAQGSAQQAVNERIAAAFVTLRRQVSEFGDGLTAPRPKSWRERHPVLYAVFLLAMGAAIGVLAAVTNDALKKYQQPASEPVKAMQPLSHPTSVQSPDPALAGPNHDRGSPTQH